MLRLRGLTCRAPGAGQAGVTTATAGWGRAVPVAAARVTSVMGHRASGSLASPVAVGGLRAVARRSAPARPAASVARLGTTNVAAAAAAMARNPPTTPVTHPAFDVVRSEVVSEHAAFAVLYVHRATGGQVLSVTCEEEEKVFGIAFPTPVHDDTGVPHILEHSVLCGSAKYPVKEPFVHLLKSSLQTYLNAMTYPDHTIYPVASPNTKDFYHLVDVYLDAVFHPRLQPWVLQQEGWHYDVATPALEQGVPRLTYSGVVFNEMKGVFSSPDAVRAYTEQRALLPSNPYAFVSGGDPCHIPDLTYQRFIQFHRDHYTPAAARIYFFGDDDVAKRLTLVDGYLNSAAAAAQVGTTPSPGTRAGSALPTAFHPRLPAPVRVNAPYPPAAGGGEEAADPAPHTPLAGAPQASMGAAAALPAAHRPELHPSNCTSQFEHVDTPSGAPDEHDVTVSWMLTTRPGEMDAVTRLGWGVLNHLLVRTHVATLYKALNDSHLGSSVIGSGYDGSLAQSTFSVGLKGVAGRNVAAVEQLIWDVLTKAEAEGFAADHVESTLNTIEFGLREFATGGGPRGLTLLLDIAHSWIHGLDPIHELRYEAPLAELKAAIAGDPRYLQRLVRAHLLDNPHRVTVHMHPDPMFTAKREAAEAEKLARAASRMTREQLAAVAKGKAALLTHQTTPDSREAVATIPTLHLTDLPLHSKRIATVTKTLTSTPTPSHQVGSGSAPGAPCLVHEQPTNGIGYATMHFDLAALPPHLLPYLPLFAHLLTATGTEKTAEEALAHRVGTHTGGVGASVSVMPLPGAYDDAIAHLVLSGKALRHKAGALTELMVEVATLALLDRKDRIVQWLRHSLAEHESGLVSSGHVYANSLLGSAYSMPGWLTEVLHGLTHYRTCQMLMQRVETGVDGGFEGVVEDLKAIRAAVMGSGNALVTVTADGDTLPGFETALTAAVQALPAGVPAHLRPHATHAPPFNTGGGHGSRITPLKHLWRWPGSGAPPHTHPPATDSRPPLPHWPFPHLLAQDSGLDSIQPAYLGIVVPTQVNYVAKAAAAVPVVRGRALSGSYDVVANLLRTDYLWDMVRVQGGAYGAFCSANRMTGVVGFGSYRDPNIAATLDAFDGAGKYLRYYVAEGGESTTMARADHAPISPGTHPALAAERQGQLPGMMHHVLPYASSPAPPATPTAAVNGDGTAAGIDVGGAGATSPSRMGGTRLSEDIRKAIIATIGSIDAPHSPAERGEVGTARYLAGITDQDVQRRRQEVLNTGVADVQAWAEAAEVVAREGRVVVVGSAAAFAAYHQDHRRPMFELVHPFGKEQ